VTTGGVRTGVVSLGAGAMLPLYVLPTTTVSMAPCERRRIFVEAGDPSSGIGWMSAEPNRFATCCAAAFERAMLVR
jgi:hypothetical protein